ncbi:hypothetical protein KIN20_002669 [Parelaphostrongylus tenuis]|uniref:Uncharacterized protein n=1 Tax=Parelaphostrongylus tenuis TaxID=148309 RepID=A0AAD5QGX2_PARTN|nr:hypothetical protein KIN20_002669 [Parelaphostrongylus tenuis]
MSLLSKRAPASSNMNLINWFCSSSFSHLSLCGSSPFIRLITTLYLLYHDSTVQAIAAMNTINLFHVSLIVILLIVIRRSLSFKHLITLDLKPHHKRRLHNRCHRIVPT